MIKVFSLHNAQKAFLGIVTLKCKYRKCIPKKLKTIRF
jgi:hypothetical protein